MNNIKVLRKINNLYFAVCIITSIIFAIILFTFLSVTTERMVEPFLFTFIISVCLILASTFTHAIVDAFADLVMNSFATNEVINSADNNNDVRLGKLIDVIKKYMNKPTSPADEQEKSDKTTKIIEKESKNESSYRINTYDIVAGDGNADFMPCLNVFI